jgi:aspartate aminotransferase
MEDLTVAEHPGMHRYAPPQGLASLLDAIAARAEARTGVPTECCNVLVAAGATGALGAAVGALVAPGDEVLILAPYWTTYPALVELARATPVYVEGDSARDFKIGPAELEAASSGKTRGLVLNSPSNPTGAVYTAEELAEIVAWARERGVWILSDEIYGSIYYGSEGVVAPGLLDLPESDLGPYVLIDGASKCFAMTGWRIGFTYAPTELSKKFTALQSQMTSNPTTPSQSAALAAYTDVGAADAAVASMLEAFQRRRDLVTTRMRELLPGVDFIDPVGAFYLYFRVDGFFDDEVKDATAWCSKLLESQGVALVPGAAFGDDRWVRMSYATSDEVLEDALTRIAAGVAAGSAS